MNAKQIGRVKLVKTASRIRFAVIGAVFGFAIEANNARAEGFDITELDDNKAVTLPHPATTYIPLPNKVILSATDRGQTIKLAATSKDEKRKAAAFHVTIFDPHAESSRKILVRPGQPVVYAFKALGSIRLEMKAPADAGSHTRLLVESNRPLEIRNITQ
ncbi:MAG: hypothetical protein ACOH5I_08435 [Oligoflexus sp.]